MSFDLFVAKRIYSSLDGNLDFSRQAIRIAICGVAIGLSVMLISLSVVLGFKDEISNKVIGFGSHLKIVSRTLDANNEIMPVIISDTINNIIEQTPGITTTQYYVFKNALLKTETDFCGIVFKGIDENYDMSFFENCLIDGKIPHFTSSESSNEILISNSTAKILGLEVGDKVFSYFMSPQSVRSRRFTVSGIFETNLTEYDRSIAFTDIYTVRRLNNWGSDMVSGCEMKVDDFHNVDHITYKLAKKINGLYDRNGAVYGTFTIKELEPNIFSWLNVLDTNVVMILILMICVSCVTIISGLLIIILERINMIGVLKSLGANNTSIRKIFINFALMIVGKGVLIGNAIGIVLCFIQMLWKPIKLDASVYYIDFIPIKMDLIGILSVNILTISLTAIVILGTSFLASKQRPTVCMKYE